MTFLLKSRDKPDYDKESHRVNILDPPEEYEKPRNISLGIAVIVVASTLIWAIIYFIALLIIG